MKTTIKLKDNDNTQLVPEVYPNCFASVDEDGELWVIVFKSGEIVNTLPLENWINYTVVNDDTVENDETDNKENTQ